MRAFIDSIRAVAVVAVTLFLVTGGAARAKVLVTYDLTHTTATGDATARRRCWDEQHLVAALQGLANRDTPRLYVFMVGPNGGGTDRFWLDYLRSPGHWLEKYQVEPATDLGELVRRFAGVYKGVVVYDEGDAAESLVASTVAGTDDLLPVRYDPSAGSLYRWLTEDSTGPHLAVKLDLRTAIPNGPTGSRKCDATLWAVDHYLKTGKCDPRHLAYYPNAFGLTSGRAPMARTLLCNHDYFIAHRAFFFDLTCWEDDAPDDDPTQPPGTDLKTLQAVLRAAHDRLADGDMIHVGGFTPWDQKYTDFTKQKHGGVETEWRFAEILSCFDAYLDADAAGLHAMANASVFQHFPLKDRYPQPNLPTDASLRAKGYLDAAGHVIPKNYATFYVGDYDSAAWLYQELPGLFADPARGTVPLGWAFNPALEQRFPVGLHFARERATPADSFVAGDSGYGYLNPGLLAGARPWSHLPPGLPRWDALCSPAYRRWDLGITGFVIDGNAPPMSDAIKAAYARFSPAGVVAQKIAPRESHAGTPFLRMNADLENAIAGVGQVTRAFPKKAPTSPQFEIFRTILWSPSKHKQLIDAVKKVRPDIEFVGPYELFRLMQKSTD